MAGSQVRIATITARCSFILDACRRPMRLVRSDHSRSPSAVLLDGDRPPSRRQQPTSVMMRPHVATGALSPAPSRHPVTSMTSTETRSAWQKARVGSGPSRPVGNKLTQVASAGRQTLGRVSGGGRSPERGASSRRPSAPRTPPRGASAVSSTTPAPARARFTAGFPAGGSSWASSCWGCSALSAPSCGPTTPSRCPSPASSRWLRAARSTTPTERRRWGSSRRSTGSRWTPPPCRTTWATRWWPPRTAPSTPTRASTPRASLAPSSTTCAEATPRAPRL